MKYLKKFESVYSSSDIDDVMDIFQEYIDEYNMQKLNITFYLNSVESGNSNNEVNSIYYSIVDINENIRRFSKMSFLRNDNFDESKYKDVHLELHLYSVSLDKSEYKRFISDMDKFTNRLELAGYVTYNGNNDNKMPILDFYINIKKIKE